jgi:DnaJ-domain-containing protein 1
MTQRTNRGTSRARAYDPDPAAPGRGCDVPGCPHDGEYRAPKSRDSLREYFWFCLDHVRAYNAAWDFYKGMSPGQIEAHMRDDTGWQRPTWPLGRLGGGIPEEDLIADRLDILGAAGLRQGRNGGRAAGPGGQAAPADLRQPLDTLGLEWPVSLDEVKSRYKELAKRNHPDANGGDRAAEERFKTINLAYALVRSHLAPGATQGAAAE